MELNRATLPAIARAIADDLLQSGAVLVDAPFVERLQLSIASVLVDALLPPKEGLPIAKSANPNALAAQLSQALVAEPVIRAVRVAPDALKGQIKAVLSRTLKSEGGSSG
ncbi:MAG: hypothetical protein IPJ65_19805 [Archangiaceae bacterium]|nr:hypothetical protein [Archangiaceae bacterium]